MIRGSAARTISLLFALSIVSLPIVSVLGAATFLVSQASLGGNLRTVVHGDGAALARSSISALAVSLLILLFVLAVGWTTAGVSLRPGGRQWLGRLCRIVPLSILPLLIGAVSFAYLYRDGGALLAGVLGGDRRGSATAILVEIIAQTIRYAPLACWLVMISITQVPAPTRGYVEGNGISGTDYAAMLLLSRWSAPLLVVTAFAFQDASNDYFIAQLALKPSIATHSELVAHALGRDYFVRLSLGAPEHAIARLIIGGALAALLFACLFVIIARLFLAWARAMPSRALRDRRPATRMGLATPWPVAMMLVGTVLLYAFAVPLIRPSHSAQIIELWPSAAISLSAAAIAWAVAAMLIFVLRDDRTRYDGSAVKAILLVSICAVAIGFIPSLSLAASVLGAAYAFDLVGESSDIWLLLTAQTIRFIPVAFILLAGAALEIPDGQIAYLKMIGAPLRSRFLVAFLRPNGWLHAATLVILFNQILNEATISSLFQGTVANFADFATRATSGRSADYGVVGAIILLQLILFGPLLLGWGSLTARAWRRRDA